MVLINNEKYTTLFYFFMFLKIINKYPYRWNTISNIYQNNLLEQIKNRLSSNPNNVKPLYDTITNTTYEPNTEKYILINQKLNEKKGLEQQTLTNLSEEKEQSKIDKLKVELSQIKTEINDINKEKEFSFHKYKITATERKELEKIESEFPVAIRTYTNIFKYLHDKDNNAFKSMNNVLQKSISFANSFENKYKNNNNQQKQLLIDFTLFLTQQKQLNSYLDTISTVIATTITTIKQFENDQNINLEESFDQNLATALKGNTEKRLVSVKKMIEIINIGFIGFIEKYKTDQNAYTDATRTLENMNYIINEFKNIN